MTTQQQRAQRFAGVRNGRFLASSMRLVSPLYSSGGSSRRARRGRMQACDWLAGGQTWLGHRAAGGRRRRLAVHRCPGMPVLLALVLVLVLVVVLLVVLLVRMVLGAAGAAVLLLSVSALLLALVTCPLDEGGAAQRVVFCCKSIRTPTVGRLRGVPSANHHMMHLR